MWWPYREQTIFRSNFKATWELKSREIFDKLANDFKLWFDFKATCSKVPRALYLEAMELKAQAYDMVAASLPVVQDYTPYNRRSGVTNILNQLANN